MPTRLFCCICNRTQNTNTVLITILLGLDFAHVVKACEWLARLHGLCYVLLKRHPGGPEAWIRDNPWIRKEAEDEKDKPEDRGGRTLPLHLQFYL